jgi:hypothetical protein
MTVMIQELDHGPAAPESGSRGDGGGGGAGGSPSPSTLQAEMMRALRREASRQARLWAD